MGPRDQRLPQIAGMAPKTSVKGKGKTHTPLSTFGTGPQVSPYSASLSSAHPTHQTHLLAATSLTPSSLVILSTWLSGATLGPGGIPLWGWKIALIQGLQLGSLGRHQGKVGETVIRTVWLPENFTPLPGHWHGDED